MHWDGTPGERGKRNGRGRGTGAPGNMSRDGGDRRFGRGSIDGEGERPRVPGWVRRGQGGGKGRGGGQEWGDDLEDEAATNTGMLTATRTESSLERRQTNTYGYKWGWAHLWDIGGIAYSIPCKFVDLGPGTGDRSADDGACSGHRDASPARHGLPRHGIVRAVGQPAVQHVGERRDLREPRALLPRKVQHVQVCGQWILCEVWHGRGRGALLSGCDWHCE